MFMAVAFQEYQDRFGNNYQIPSGSELLFIEFHKKGVAWRTFIPFATSDVEVQEEVKRRWNRKMNFRRFRNIMKYLDDHNQARILPSGRINYFPFYVTPGIDSHISFMYSHEIDLDMDSTFAIRDLEYFNRLNDKKDVIAVVSRTS